MNKNNQKNNIGKTRRTILVINIQDDDKEEEDEERERESQLSVPAHRKSNRVEMKLNEVIVKSH